MERILASASPRRRDLLGSLWPAFRVEPVEVDETTDALPPRAGAREVAKALALKKALACAAGPAGPGPFVVLGADTIVVSPDGALLGKPEGPDEADAILRALDGAWHRVVTGVALVSDRGRQVVLVEESEVRIGPLQGEDRARYIASELWRGKAGGYGIQDEADPSTGLGTSVVTGLVGSRSNVIGLPVEALAAALPIWEAATR